MKITIEAETDAEHERIPNPVRLEGIKEYAVLGTQLIGALEVPVPIQMVHGNHASLIGMMASHAELMRLSLRNADQLPD